MKRETKRLWESLPAELIGCIGQKLEGDFKAISNVRALSKHWRESSLLVTSFKIELRPKTDKHLSSMAYQCYLTSLATFISKTDSLRRLVVHASTFRSGPANIVIDDTNNLLEACDWTNLSHSLYSLDIHIWCEIGENVNNLLANCRSLSELKILSKRRYLGLNPDAAASIRLSFELMERLTKLHIGGWTDPEWLSSLPQLPYIEELVLSSISSYHHTISSTPKEKTIILSAPKLRTLKMRITEFGTLKVEAPLIRSMEILGVERLHVINTSLELQSITMQAGTLLVADSPQCVKKLVIQGFCVSYNALLTTLLSLRAMPFITSLKIAPFPIFGTIRSLPGDRRPCIADTFISEVGRLSELNELEMNVHVIDLLKGVGPLQNLLPKLETVFVKLYPEFVLLNHMKDAERAFGDGIVEVLEEFKFKNLKTRIPRGREIRNEIPENHWITKVLNCSEWCSE